MTCRCPVLQTVPTHLDGGSNDAQRTGEDGASSTSGEGKMENGSARGRWGLGQADDDAGCRCRDSAETGTSSALTRASDFFSRFTEPVGLGIS